MFSGEIITANNVTGWVKGAQISIDGVDNTKFNVSAGKVKIVNYPVDPENPSYTVLEWSNTLISNAGILGTNRSKWVGIRDNGFGQPELVVQLNFSTIEKRSIAVIGKIRNAGGAGPIITNIDDYETPCWNLFATLQDLMYSLGSFSIVGNTIFPTTTLQLGKTNGTSWRYHAEDIAGQENIHADQQDNPRTSYAYLRGDSNSTTAATQIDAENYDLNGVVTPVSVGKFTKQEIYIFPVSGTWYVLYGTAEYGNLNDAIMAEHRLMSQTMTSLLDGSYHAASLIIKKGTTNISNAISTDTARLIAVKASVSSIPLLLPGIYIGATITSDGKTGTVPAAAIADMGKALFGDGTWKTALSPTSDNFYTGQNVYKDSKFFITKQNDQTAMMAFNLTEVPTGTTVEVRPPNNVEPKLASLNDTNVVFCNTTQRLANTTLKPTYYTSKRFYDATLQKKIRFRQLNTTPVYAWFDDDGIDEYLADVTPAVPLSPTNGQVYTSPKGYVYTYNTAQIYWVLTGLPYSLSDSAPLVGAVTASAGTSKLASRADHVHPLYYPKSGYDLTSTTLVPKYTFTETMLTSGLNNQAIYSANVPWVFENIDKAEAYLPFALQKVTTFFKNLENDTQFDQLIGLHPSYYGMPYGSWCVTPNGGTDMDNSLADAAGNSTSITNYASEYFTLIVGKNPSGTEIYTFSFTFSLVGNAAWDGAKLYPFRIIYQNSRGTTSFNWSGTLVTNGVTNGVPKCTAYSNGFNLASYNAAAFPLCFEPVTIGGNK